MPESGVRINEPSAPGREDILLQHLAVLVAGFFLGMVAAYLVTGLGLDFSASLEEARRLGVVSPTTLAGYPKGRDTFNYAVVVLLPTFFSVATWLVCLGREKRSLAAGYLGAEGADEERGQKWRFPLAAVLVIYCLVSFNVSYFYKVNENPFVGAWPFLGEEGTTLANVQSILSDGLFSRDFASGYGPLLVYPVAWFMKVFGTTVMSQRVCAALMNACAYGVIVAFFYRTLTRKSCFVAAALLYLFLYPPFVTAGPNATYLRVALGFLPLLLVYLNYSRESARLYLAAGIAAGLCLLMSQEVGICVVLALAVFLVGKELPNRDFRRLLRGTLLVAAGCVAALAPFLLYFGCQGVLGAFFTDMLVYPKLYMLGYSAIPFPSFRQFLHSPLNPALLVHYWVLFLYVAAAIYLVPLLLMGKLGRRSLLQASLLVFGLLLYRSALCRSDLSHVLFAAQPALVLLFLFLDGLLRSSTGGRATAGRWLGAGAAALLVGYFLLLVCSQGVRQKTVGPLLRYGVDLSSKWSVRPGGVQPYGVERAGGVTFSPGFADTLTRIDSFLRSHTRPGDYVYFFPNEAAYYFLFNRNNPTRYAFSYQAVTTDQRREVVAELEKNRPEYVVYSRNTWRMDGIPEEVQVPEVYDYLLAAYAPAQELGDVLVLKRKTP
jgi:hypothetical protein